MNTPERLQTYLADYGRRYPAAWRQYEYYRGLRGQGLPRWPDWCYCPLAAAYAIVSGGGENIVPPERLRDIGILGALAAWRITKGIYRYDSDLFEALWNTTLEGNLPIDILYHLPEWCVYVEVPIQTSQYYEWLNKKLLGWFAYLEWDANTSRPELRLVIDINELRPMPIHLTHSTLYECVKAAMIEGSEQAKKLGINLDPEICMQQVAAPLASLVSVTLYLCSVAADIADRRGRQERPRNPQAVKTKQGLRIFPASNPTEWNVGFRIGAALRLAQQDPGEPRGGHHASPRPHIRKAHWHSFWTGPRAGERKIVLKWLPPIPVGAGELVPTIHKVD